MPKKDVDFSEADFKKEVNKILKSMDIPLDPDSNYPEEIKELWPAIQSKLGKKLLAKNWRVWTTMWTNVIGPTYVSAAKEAAKAAGVKYRGEIGSFAKKYHRDHGLALCKTLTETDLQRVQDQIVDNWGIGEKAFEKKFQDDYIGSDARLKTIYRSEHARAISEGALEVGQEVGHQYKQWWCAEDERSCEICMAHHEETVPMDEAFSGGFAIPQDSHPSCRCVLITLDESDLSDDQKSRIASRDPIMLDDLEPTFRNSPWKSNEAFRQILNYKCPRGTVNSDTFKCATGGIFGQLKEYASKEIHRPEIIKALNDRSSEIWNNISEDDRTYIKEYSKQTAVNQLLLDGPLSPKDKILAQNQLKSLDYLMTKSKSPIDVVTYSGLKDWKSFKQAVPELNEVGASFKTKAFISTSTRTDIANFFSQLDYSAIKDNDRHILEIYVPEGTPSFYMDNEKTEPDQVPRTNESQLLLDRDLTFEVIGITKQDEVTIHHLKVLSKSIESKSNEAFRQVLNYKCKSGTVDDSNKCDEDATKSTNKRSLINSKLTDDVLEKIGKQYDSATMGSSKQDMRLNRMAKLVGFDGKPEVISEAELEQYATENKLDIMYRGVSSSKHAEQFRTGEYWAGKGFNGNGTYAAYGSEGKSLAKKYAPSEMDGITFDDCVMKMCMTKDAKIINYDDLISRIPKVLKQFPNAKKYIGSDEGKIATILGYDAIRLPPEDDNAYKEGSWGNMIILNRSKVMVVK